MKMIENNKQGKLCNRIDSVFKQYKIYWKCSTIGLMLTVRNSQQRIKSVYNELVKSNISTSRHVNCIDMYDIIQFLSDVNSEVVDASVKRLVCPVQRVGSLRQLECLLTTLSPLHSSSSPLSHHLPRERLPPQLRLDWRAPISTSSVVCDLLRLWWRLTWTFSQPCLHLKFQQILKELR